MIEKLYNRQSILLQNGSTFRFPKGTYTLMLETIKTRQYNGVLEGKILKISCPRFASHRIRTFSVAKIFRKLIAQEHIRWLQTYVEVMHERYFPNVQSNFVRFKDMKTRWGSCSSKKNLNFSNTLLFIPPNLQFYLIAHEMAHLEHLHHKREFWNRMATLVPTYKKDAVQLRRTRIVFELKLS